MSEDDVKFFKRLSQYMSMSLAEDIDNRAQTFIENTYADAKKHVPQMTRSDARNWLNVDQVAPEVQSGTVLLIPKGSNKIKKVPKVEAWRLIKEDKATLAPGGN